MPGNRYSPGSLRHRLRDRAHNLRIGDTMNFELAEWLPLLQKNAIAWGVNVLLALLVFVVGRWIAKLLSGVFKRILIQAKVDELAAKFLTNVIYSILIAAVIIASLDRLGVNTTSLLAIMGAAGLAIGLALKDSLSNFAAGVMLIFFRPFRSGDFIDAAGVQGVVEQVRVFSTVLRSPDNREITIPNAAIYNGTITNVSARPTRRIDLIFSVAYSDDLSLAKQLISEILENEMRVLKDPKPTVDVAELAASSVDIYVRPWVKTSDYWSTRCALIEKVKLAFDEKGISIPFPQQDVHLYKQEGA